MGESEGGWANAGQALGLYYHRFVLAVKSPLLKYEQTFNGEKRGSCSGGVKQL